MNDYWNNPPEDDFEEVCPKCGEQADRVSISYDGCGCVCTACGHEWFALHKKDEQE